MAAPLVSVVMPCYNAYDHLPRSVGSVLAQTFEDWELIAVDDGSTDGTRAWLEGLSDTRIHVHPQPNRGVSAARNAGLGCARGEYVAFLDADDTWEPDFLAAMHAALDARPDAALAYCGWQNVGLPGPRGQPYVPPDYEADIKLSRLFDNCGWPIHACLTRREAIVTVGGFDPRFRTSEDYLLWLNIAKDRPIHRVPRVLAYYHFHGGGQATSNRAQVAINHFLAQRAFLDEHPLDAAKIPLAQRKHSTMGRLIERGLECHWSGDFDPARQVFRAAFAFGDRDPAHLRYLLPSLLPRSLHRMLVSFASWCRPPAR